MKIPAIFFALLVSLTLSAQEGSWTIVNRELPVDEVFDAGSKVVVVIDYDNQTNVDYINESDTTITVIFHVSDNGTPLPDERIGPVKYRTKTLEPGESVEMTFAWAKGHEVAFEISGGSLHVKASPKKSSI